MDPNQIFKLLHSLIFNVLNTPAYGDPSVTSINSNGGEITAPTFFQTYTPDARFIQFSLKYIF